MTSFTEKVYEIAFGDDALLKGYSQEDVLARLQKFSDDALVLEELDEDRNKIIKKMVQEEILARLDEVIDGEIGLSGNVMTVAEIAAEVLILAPKE